MSDLLVTSRSFGSGDLDLRGDAAQAGLHLLWGPSHHSLDELAPLLPSVRGWIAGTGPITKDHLDLAPELRVIARYGVGTDMVDLEEAARRDITVTNTPGANSAAVADLTVALILSALRHIPSADRAVRTKNWDARVGRELGALTIGLIGFGRIGQGVATRLAGFGCPLIAFDPVLDPFHTSDGAVTSASNIDEVLQKSDVVSLHAPGGQVVITAERLALTRPGAVIVNTARADLVDEQALADALRYQQLGGYAADSLHGDTASMDSPLLADDIAPLVTLTPHIGAQTTQAIDSMGQMALANILAVLSDQPPINPVTASAGRHNA